MKNMWRRLLVAIIFTAMIIGYVALVANITFPVLDRDISWVLVAIATIISCAVFAGLIFSAYAIICVVITIVKCITFDIIRFIIYGRDFDFTDFCAVLFVMPMVLLQKIIWWSK